MKPRMRRIVLLTALALAVTGAAGASTVAILRATAPVPQATVLVHAPAQLVAVPGDPMPIPLPSTGSITLSEAAGSQIADREGATVRPIGSIAKTMTALVTLAMRPLHAGEQGPLLTMSNTDVVLYDQALGQQGSAVAVSAGERWSERDLLLALMLPSANNIAETLARWVAADRAAFISLLNQRASALGMSSTHFDDPSGISAATVSTTRDLVLLGRAALSDPSLAGIVATQSAQLPDGAKVSNLDVLLSTQPGWLGIKTGWTPLAGGCLLFAAEHTYATGTAPVLVVGAVLAQPAKPSVDPAHPELGGAVQAAEQAVATTFGNDVAVDLAAITPSVSGSITTAWDSSSPLQLGRAQDRYTVVRRGETLAVTVSVLQPVTPVAAGTVVGRVTGAGPNGLLVTWPLRAARDVQAPSLWWKLLHA